MSRSPSVLATIDCANTPTNNAMTLKDSQIKFMWFLLRKNMEQSSISLQFSMTECSIFENPNPF